MKKLIALPAALIALTAGAYTPLDPANPIDFDGSRVVYNGDTIVPGPRCFYVDGSLTADEAAANPYVFTTFNDAAAQLTDGTSASPMEVYIAPWVYWVDDPDDPEVRRGKDGREPFGLVIKCNALRLHGLNPDPRNTVIAAARGQTQGAVGNFTMLDIWGDDFLAEFLTLGNFCNVDLDFPLRPVLGREKRNKAITQAHVAYLHGDRAVARNVRFISRLNMNPLNGARRILFDRCHMESTDDALTGTGVYLGCTLDFYAPRPFWNTHANGAVFLDCDFTVCHNSGRQYFCKSVGPVEVIDCRYHAESPTYIGWTHYPTPWLRGYQHNVTLNGEPITIGAEQPENTVTITDRRQLDAFALLDDNGKTVYNIYNLLRGDDNWDPMGTRAIAEAFDADNLATCLTVTPREASVTTGDGVLTLTARSFRHAGFPIDNRPVRWKISPADERFVRLSATSGDSITVTPVNDTDTTIIVNITATTPEGLEGVASLKVSPALLPAPAFISEPVITVSDQTARVDYSLDLAGRDDRSEISWYRCDGPSDPSPRLVAVSRMDKPMKEYKLTADDAGHYLKATVAPRHIRSHSGSAVATRPVKIKRKDTDTRRILETDFLNFPTLENQPLQPGSWTVDGYKPADTAEYPWATEEGEHWYYGTGINGARGTGLSQRRKGARLRYTPLEDIYSDMTLHIEADPAKTAGQGFGSATGQYLDIMIKYDTQSLTGYGLRIIRTTRHSNAVDFMLIESRDGKVTQISEPVSAICYRTGCSITVKAEGNRLSAHVETSTPLSEPSDPALHKTVDLAADITPNDFGGISIQHTGSTGESATMLHRLKAEWK